MNAKKVRFQAVPPEVMDNIIGPGSLLRRDNHLADRADLRAALQKYLDQEISHSAWSAFSGNIAKARLKFLFGRPPTPDSKDRVKALADAAHQFRVAFKAVLEGMKLEKFIPGPNILDHNFEGILAIGFYELSEYFNNEESDADLSWALVQMVEKLEKESNKLIRRSAVGEHGRAHKIHGYDEFLFACSTIWSKEILPIDCKKIGGRWKGPFIEFVNASQILLPANMRRGSKDAIGAAIFSWRQRTS